MSHVAVPLRRAVFLDRDGVLNEPVIVDGRPGLDDVLVCPHDDADGCTCRKPQPGMILEAAARWQVTLRGSVMVGDRWRDVDAGRGAGCRTVLLARDYDERRAAGADLVVGTLEQAVSWIVSPGFDGEV